LSRLPAALLPADRIDELELAMAEMARDGTLEGLFRHGHGAVKTPAKSLPILSWWQQSEGPTPVVKMLTKRQK
jgi:hypothetical protein